MKQNLLSLFSLLAVLFTAQGAWALDGRTANGELFKAFIYGDANTDYVVGGGSISFPKDPSPVDKLWVLNGKTMVCRFDNPLAAGDVITIQAAFSAASASNGIRLRAGESGGSGGEVLTPGSDYVVTDTYGDIVERSYTVQEDDQYAGQTAIQVFRNTSKGPNSYVRSITVKRSGVDALVPEVLIPGTKTWDFHAISGGEEGTIETSLVSDNLFYAGGSMAFDTKLSVSALQCKSTKGDLNTLNSMKNAVMFIVPAGEGTVTINHAFSYGDTLGVLCKVGTAEEKCFKKNSKKDAWTEYQLSYNVAVPTPVWVYQEGQFSFVKSISVTNGIANTVTTGTKDITDATITWNFKGVNPGDFTTCGVASDDIKPYMQDPKLEIGRNLNISPVVASGGIDYTLANPYRLEKDGTSVYEMLLKPTSQRNSQNEADRLTFIAAAKDGFTFTPTNVALKTSKYVTDNESVKLYFNNGDVTNSLTEKSINPERASVYNKDNIKVDDGDDYKQYTESSIALSDYTASKANSLLVYIYNVATNKLFGIGDVVITGNMSVPTYEVTLDEMATVHDLGNMPNATVKMKRGLSSEYWNTFCVPFSLTKEQLQTVLDDEVEIVEFARVDGKTLYFEKTDKIEAGKPYLIKPANFDRVYSEDMEPITFENVDIVAATANTNSGSEAGTVTIGDYDFVGTYVRYSMANDGTELGMTTKNKLSKPSATPKNIMRGLRCFFRHNTTNGAGAKVIIGGELTSIEEIDAPVRRVSGVYHISGQYVRADWNNGSGLPRGLYIVDGKKMVVR